MSWKRSYTIKSGTKYQMYQGSPPWDEDCKGPNTKCITFMSADNVIFKVWKEHAMISGTIGSCFGPPIIPVDEGEENVYKFDDLNAKELKLLCEYFVYKARWLGCTTQKNPGV